MIKIMICDDIEEICTYFSEILNTQDDMTVVCTADSYDSAIENAGKYHPDIILMDIHMDTPKAGIRAAAKISEIHPEIKIILLTIHSNIELITEAFINNVVEYIIKDTDNETIFKTIRSVYSSETYLGKIINNTVKAHVQTLKKQTDSLLYVTTNLTQLTPTELKILEHLCKGEKKASIASKEYISQYTLKVHIRHILHKLKFKTTHDMVTFLNNMNILPFIEVITRKH